MLLYHASLEKVDLDNIDPVNGIHFGAKSSAFEAVLRKNPTKDQPIYMYLLDIKIEDKDIYFCDDVGNAENWREQIKQAKLDNKAVIKYKNKYEPAIDNPYSYIFFKVKRESIIGVVYKRSLLEDFLDEFYKEYE